MSVGFLPREKQLASELKNLILAGAPIILLYTWEEDAAERVVRQVATELKKSVYIWNSTRGFHKGIDDKSAANVDIDPYDALTKLRNAGGALALLKDFHRFFDNGQCVRGLRDIVFESAQGGPQMILVSPSSLVPDELRKDVSQISLPLPNADELKTILTDVLESVGKNLDPALMEQASVAAAGLTARQSERVYKMSASALPGEPGLFLERIIGQKRSLAREALALEFLEPTVSFDLVGGLEVLKKWLDARSQAFTGKAREYGLPTPRGLLLLGVQGCGKSMSAKSVARLWKLPLLRLDLSRIDPVSGELMLMEALHTSEAVSPAVLWIDEIEKGFGRSETVGGGVSLRALSAFITWLQEKNSPVYVVATANSIRQMPPELLRKGRFDEIFFVDLPSRRERIEIFDIHLSKRKRNPADFDVETLADESDGFSGAEIEAVVVAGMFEGFAENREVKTEDILYACRTTIPLSTTMDDEIQELRDWARGRARPASLDTKLADLLQSQGD